VLALCNAIVPEASASLLSVLLADAAAAPTANAAEAAAAATAAKVALAGLLELELELLLLLAPESLSAAPMAELAADEAA
jgi:hypothetical protein